MCVCHALAHARLALLMQHSVHHVLPILLHLCISLITDAYKFALMARTLHKSITHVCHALAHVCTAPLLLPAHHASLTITI